MLHVQEDLFKLIGDTEAMPKITLIKNTLCCVVAMHYYGIHLSKNFISIM